MWPGVWTNALSARPPRGPVGTLELTRLGMWKGEGQAGACPGARPSAAGWSGSPRLSLSLDVPGPTLSHSLSGRLSAHGRTCHWQSFGRAGCPVGHLGESPPARPWGLGPLVTRPPPWPQGRPGKLDSRPDDAPGCSGGVAAAESARQLAVLLAPTSPQPASSSPNTWAYSHCLSPSRQRPGPRGSFVWALSPRAV